MIHWFRRFLSRKSMIVLFSVPGIFLICFVGVLRSESVEWKTWELSIQERFLTRKNVSHMAIDVRENEYRLVLLTSDRFPYNYKSVSYPLFFRLETEKQALHLMKKISDYLETGERMTVKLNGSEIKGVIFHEPYHSIP